MVSQRNIQAEITREKIVNTAAEEIYRVGFQAASIGQILNKLSISKGGFYHHFANKQELGYAVLEESFVQMQGNIWGPLISSHDPLKAIINMFTHASEFLDCERIKLGCPINNLAQEMSPIDEGFRIRVERIYQEWRKQLTHALQRAQKENKMVSTVNAEEVVTLIMAVTQGAIGMAKNAQRPEIFNEYTRGLVHYLKSLRTTGAK